MSGRPRRASNASGLELLVSYAVESDLPIGASAVSSEYAEIVTNDAYHLTVSLPLEAEFTPDGNGGYAFSTSPVNVGAVLTNAVGGCCSPTLETNGFRWVCAADCGCSGGVHWLNGRAVWEGYSWLFGWEADCTCYYERLSNPSLWLSLSLPRVVVVGGWLGAVSATFNPPVATNGTLSLRLVSGHDKLALWDSTNRLSQVSLSQTWDAHGHCSMNFFVEGLVASDAVGDVAFEWEYVEENGTLHSVTQTMTVAEIRHETMFETPSNRDRTLLGVGENVFFFFKPHNVVTNVVCTAGAVTEPSPYQQWSEGGGFAETDMDVSVFLASHTAAVSQVTMDLDGCLHDWEFAIVEPEGFFVESVDSVYYDNEGYSGLFDLTFNNLLMPTNVSFGMVQVMEVPMVATNAVGYYAQPSKADWLDHGTHGAGQWRNVGVNNRSDDFVRAGYNPPPWLAGGSFTWPIPVAWRVYGDEGVTNVFTQTDQRFELDADGTARVKKFGYCGERTTNSVFRIDEEER